MTDKAKDRLKYFFECALLGALSAALFYEIITILDSWGPS